MAARTPKSPKAGRRSKASSNNGRKSAKRSSAAKTQRAASKSTATAKTAERPSGLTPLIRRLRKDLGADHQPAWLIDVARAHLIPLNTAGAHLFATDESQTDGIALDHAMPALATLQDLAKKKASKKKTVERFDETLLFWLPEGARSLTCRIARHKARGQTIFLVQADDNGAHKPVSNQDVDAPRIEPPRDDAAILREIARRIRAGTSDQPEITDVPGELPVPTDVSPPNQDPTPLATDNAQLSAHDRAQLAHELRTPISAIVAAAEVLKDERLGALDNYHYRDYARDIFQSARHALEVIEKGLDAAGASQTTAAKPQAHRADLNHIVGQAVATTKHLAQARQLDITFVASERDTWLDVDPTPITQIVLNLLTNAVKFSPPGGSVTAQVYANIGEDVCVEIRDTGPGMSARDIAEHMRGPKDKHPHRRPGGGLGLGLALSRQLADDNGARLDVESALGRGTTARLAFPLRCLVAA